MFILGTGFHIYFLRCLAASSHGVSTDGWEGRAFLCYIRAYGCCYIGLNGRVQISRYPKMESLDLPNLCPLFHACKATQGILSRAESEDVYHQIRRDPCWYTVKSGLPVISDSPRYQLMA